MATMDYTHRNSIYHTNPKWRRYMVIRSTRCKRFCLCDYFSPISEVWRKENYSWRHNSSDFLYYFDSVLALGKKRHIGPHTRLSH